MVDDEPVILEALKLILHSGGHTVELAGCAEHALDILARTNFDLVITDYQMPGMKGDELVAQVKARVPRQKMIMLTGMPEQVLASGQSQMAEVVMCKPFRSQDLLEAIQKLLDKAPQDSQASIEVHAAFSAEQLLFEYDRPVSCRASLSA